MANFSLLVNLVLFSGIATLLLVFIFKDNKVILQLDTRFLLICMAIILCRMLIPIESPLTNNIAVRKIYPSVYRFLRQRIGTEFYGGMTILTLMKLIWLVVAIIFLARLFYSYISICRRIKKYGKIRDGQVKGLLDKVSQQYGYKKKVQLAHMEEGLTPCIFGILHPYILIPDIEVTENELEYIFAHEMGHYHRGDLLLKLLCEIFKAVYWWNPFSYVLCILIAQAQEINVDFSIMRRMPRENILEYSSCLIKLRRKQQKQKREERWLMGFQKESTFLLTKRIELMMNNLDISVKKTVQSIILSIMMVGLIAVCPNVISFEAYNIPEQDIDDSVGLREDDKIFYLENEDGTYEIYINGKSYSLEGESVKDIPVYSDLEEAYKDD